MKLQPGDPAPDFRLRNQDGEEVSLVDFAGRRVCAVLLSEGHDARLNEAGLRHA